MLYHLLKTCSKMVLSEEKAEEILENVLNKILKNDSFLLVNDVNERTISHKIAEYLNQEVSDEWDVDCEYNRNFDEIKVVHFEVPNPSSKDTQAKTVYPDIIVHKRNTGENLIVLEIKKSSNNDDGNYDRKKLEAYKRNLDYEYAYFISLITNTEKATYNYEEVI